MQTQSHLLLKMSTYADTESPTAEDEYINSVSDPELQTQLRWAKYLRRLRQGAWGDNLTIQAIADMLSVKINVLSSDYPAASVTPSNSSDRYLVLLWLA